MSVLQVEHLRVLGWRRVRWGGEGFLLALLPWGAGDR